MSDSESDFEFEDYDKELAKLDKPKKGKGLKGTKQLVIVESPAKTKKIGGFLGNDYIVEASFGHIRKLGSKGDTLGVDVNNKFKPTYSIDDGGKYKKGKDKRPVVVNLKKKLKDCHTVWLATDYDREGEGIAWHCVDVLGLDKSKIKVHRIVFKKITKKEIIHAVKNPQVLDQNMVHSQQARQILDKLLGFRVSSTLHRRFNNFGLSAGRVQSVAVKLILERENDIKKFESKKYFKVDAQFLLNNPKKEKAKKSKGVIQASLDTNFEELDEAEEFIEACKLAKFTIKDIKTNNTKRKPSPPFTTSSLQQEASAKLGYSPKRTMQAAQKLYEGGHITYMRTDSVMLAEEALEATKDKIIEEFGQKYHNEVRYKTKKQSSQEAHEACRPCKMDVSDVTAFAGPEQGRLYKLIWARTMASQMSHAKVEIKTVKIKMNNRSELFVAKGEEIKFDGFIAVWNRIKSSRPKKINKKEQDYEIEEEEQADDIDQMEIFKELSEDQKLYYQTVNAVEKLTKPPHARYTEASLVKKLEDLEIGRPSTYASIISTIQSRDYVQRKNQDGTVVKGTSLHLNYSGDVSRKEVENKMDSEKNKLFITDLGKLTCEYLSENFEDIMNYKFTAHVETMLDEIAQGKKVWYKVIKSVYDKFNPVVENIISQFKDKGTGGGGSYERILGQDPDTGRNVVVLVARYGPVVCLTHPDDKKKCKYSGLDKNSIESVTLNEALDLLKYPYTVGQWENADVIIKNGPNGYYLHHDGRNYSLMTNEGEHNLYETITLKKAVKYIEEKRKESASNVFAEFNKGKIRVLLGKYGPYIAYDDKGKRINIKVPAKYKPDEMTKEDCLELINNKINKAKKDDKKTTGVKKTTGARAKKTTTGAKKAATGAKKAATGAKKKTTAGAKKTTTATKKDKTVKTKSEIKAKAKAKTTKK